MADISRITLPNGSTYDIKDATARTQISSEAATRKAADDAINNNINSLKSNLTGAMHYIGITTTPLTDGQRFSYNPAEQTEDPTVIDINGRKYKPESGDVVIYQNKEFVAIVIFTETIKNVTWNEFGSTGSLKALAFKDSASGSVTPSGTVSTPTFTGTQGNISVDLPGYQFVDAYSLTSVAWSYDTTNKRYTDPGSSAAGRMVTAVQPTARISKAGVVSLNKKIGTVKQVSTVGTLPTFSATVNDETLSFSFNAGSLPTTSDVYVVTQVDSVYTDPEIEVSPLTIFCSPYNTFIKLNGTFTPRGTISQPTFTGNASNVTVK